MDGERQKLTAKMLRDRYNQAYLDRHNAEKIREQGLEPLANREHYAFARSLIHEKPWMFPSVVAATPLYYAAKKLKLLPEDRYTSEATLEQMGSGLRGAWHGLTR